MSFPQGRAEVERLLAEQEEFERIEEVIDSHEDLDDDQRSALWLYAWSHVERSRQVDAALHWMDHFGHPHPRREVHHHA
jgi:hypothetical protein